MRPFYSSFIKIIIINHKKKILAQTVKSWPLGLFLYCFIYNNNNIIIIAYQKNLIKSYYYYYYYV